VNGLRRAVLLARALQRCGERGSPREYRCGEDVRAIDWHASARAGTLQLRERQLELPLAWSAVVDRSPSMNAGRRRTLVTAAREAAAFWRDCSGADDCWVDSSPPEQPFDLRASLESALERLPAHTALLVAGDFHELATVPRMLLRTLARRADCTALIAGDPWRDELALAGFVVVVDLESGERRRFYVAAQHRARYAEAVRAREAGIRQLLHEAGWRTAIFDESNGVSAVLRAFRLA
jgi:uncharacterized protein (DUF58 family)